eukprot:6465706-Amphidinium_carterae.5
MAACSKEPATELASSVESLMIAGRGTKCAGCLLDALSSDAQGTKLRALVKAEVVEFRGYAGKSKETDVLPKKLLERVQAVLGGSA